MPAFPLRTARLSLRIMQPRDAATLAGYRGDAEIARYQTWPMPFTVDHARAMLADQVGVTDVVPGRYVQIAIDHNGTVVGDVGVGLNTGGTIASIGYTLDRRWQGRGFASEAAAALVDALIADTGVHRIVATLDPANHASLRVLELLGFRSEGLARAAEFTRDEWVDDLRFALLEQDRREWLGRPTSRPAAVELVEITPDNLDAVRGLETFLFQEKFVAPVATSLAQALVPPVVGGHPLLPWYRAVVADGEVVGFVMVAAVTEWHRSPYLWRLLIDRRHQHRRIGERVIGLLVESFRADGSTSMRVSWVQMPGGPQRFYERLGFKRTGVADNGEIEARLEFAQWRR